MLRAYKADLHIHTVLSPCADLSMGPRDIVKQALQKQLDLIAITDHHSAENVQAVVDSASGTGLMVIPGMEVYVREEAHLICLFPNMQAIGAFQDFVYSMLQEGENDPSMFGPQLVVDKDENIVYENSRLLSLPLRASAEQIAHKVEQNGGLIYPAHIDRKSFSILRVMGFIPAHLPFYAVEISQPLEQARNQLRFLNDTPYSIIRASDAHHIEQIGAATTTLHLEEPTFSELRLALQKKDGRYCEVDKYA
jgi:3',5'-nucleoside bisphosphate phosphatase